MIIYFFITFARKHLCTQHYCKISKVILLCSISIYNAYIFSSTDIFLNSPEKENFLCTVQVVMLFRCKKRKRGECFFVPFIFLVTTGQLDQSIARVKMSEKGQVEVESISLKIILYFSCRPTIQYLVNILIYREPFNLVEDIIYPDKRIGLYCKGDRVVVKIK